MVGVQYPCRCVLPDGTKCKERFAKKSERDKHIKNAHGLVACVHQSCGMGFKSKEEMMQHMRSLPDHKHLVCRVCHVGTVLHSFYIEVCTFTVLFNPDPFQPGAA